MLCSFAYLDRRPHSLTGFAAFIVPLCWVAHARCHLRGQALDQQSQRQLPQAQALIAKTRNLRQGNFCRARSAENEKSRYDQHYISILTTIVDVRRSVIARSHAPPAVPAVTPRNASSSLAKGATTVPYHSRMRFESFVARIRGYETSFATLVYSCPKMKTITMDLVRDHRKRLQKRLLLDNVASEPTIDTTISILAHRDWRLSFMRCV